ncbi:MAG: hypothetical protein JW762_15935 [Dehalococcoidales bacterium]|nr:hypothetical protein [Dehalococcoidales bacterium]
MKKVLLLVSALLIVFSGVAAVSAYEGHVVDVKAHVENALMVEDEVDFGVVFPQEKKEAVLHLALSQSFRDQKYYSSVDFRVFWEPKPIGEHVVGIEDPDNAGYFIPLYPYVVTEVMGFQTEVIDTANASIKEIVALTPGTIFTLNIQRACDAIHFSLNPPVFDEWYNAGTEALIAKTPSGILGPDYYYTTTENITCSDGYYFEDEVPHTDLGSNLKIQVIEIYGD